MTIDMPLKHHPHILRDGTVFGVCEPGKIKHEPLGHSQGQLFCALFGHGGSGLKKCPGRRTGTGHKNADRGGTIGGREKGRGAHHAASVAGVDRVQRQLAARAFDQGAGLLWARVALAATPTCRGAQFYAVAGGELLVTEGFDVVREGRNGRHRSIIPQAVEFIKALPTRFVDWPYPR